MTPAVQAVERALKQGPLTTSQLAERLGIGRHAASRRARKLIRMGRARRVDTGVYELVHAS